MSRYHMNEPGQKLTEKHWPLLLVDIILLADGSQQDEYRLIPLSSLQKWSESENFDLLVALEGKPKETRVIRIHGGYLPSFGSYETHWARQNLRGVLKM